DGRTGRDQRRNSGVRYGVVRKPIGRARSEIRFDGATRRTGRRARSMAPVPDRDWRIAMETRRKRRFCAECRLIEPAEGLTNGDCPACAWRKDRVAPIPEKKRRTWKSPAPIDGRGFLLCRQANVIPGFCTKCKKHKPLDQFGARVAQEPLWRPHRAWCKWCVTEATKDHIWRRQLSARKAELRALTIDELASEAKSLNRRLALVREEIRSRTGV